jgi:hypothetical protein
VRFAPAGAATVTATLTAAAKKGRVSATVALSGRGSALGSAPGQLHWADAVGSISGANVDGSNPRALISGQYRPGGVTVAS